MKPGPLLVGAAMLLTPAAHASTESYPYLQDALQRADAAIIVSREAARRAGTPAAAIFAKQAEYMNRSARQQLLPSSEEISDAGMTPRAASELQVLSMLVGKEFDVEYLRYMAHEQSAQAYDLRQEARFMDGSSSQIAQAQLPLVEAGAERAKILQFRERGEPNE